MKSSLPLIFIDKEIFTLNSFLGYNIIAGIIPIIISAIVFYIWRGKLNLSDKFFVYVYFGGSILHCIYTTLFTRFHTMYWWYYISHIILFAFAVALLLKNRPIKKGVSIFCIFLLIASFCFGTIFKRYHENWVSSKQSPWLKLLTYLDNHNIRDKSIFVSEVPGVIGFYSKNNIIAADMITSNIIFYEIMKKSPNALMYIMNYCKKLGKPIEYYLHMEGGFMSLKTGRDFLEIIYNDPKTYPLKNPIGKFYLATNSHVFSASYTAFILWKFNDKMLSRPQQK